MRKSDTIVSAEQLNRQTMEEQSLTNNFSKNIQNKYKNATRSVESLLSVQENSEKGEFFQIKFIAL